MTYTVLAADITAGSITNHATAAAAGVSSNQDSVTIPGTTPNADLAVTKTSTPKPYVAGAPLTYTITVTNHGPHAISNGTVSDTIPVAGCVRLDNDAIRRLAGLLPNGTPVDIM